MAVVSREVQLIERPTGLPLEGQFTIASRELPDPGPGQLLIRNLYLSLDPAMRTPLSNGQTALNAPIAGHALGEVVASRNAGFAVGDHVLHTLGFREYALSDGAGVNVLDVQSEPLSAHLGVLGITGLTAYAGILVVAGLKQGENVFVSAAAGAVGSVAAQIAKLRDCYVIGSAGSAEKCAWLRDVAGLDVAVNYREGVFRKSLKAAAPNGIDVFFDNVGGAQMDAAMPRMNMRGRVALCGMISAYNNPGALSEGVHTLSVMMYNRIRMEGFVVWDYEYLRPQFLADMRAWIASGRLKYQETIVDGLEEAPRALIGLFTGMNSGKMLVRL